MRELFEEYRDAPIVEWPVAGWQVADWVGVVQALIAGAYD